MQESFWMYLLYIIVIGVFLILCGIIAAYFVRKIRESKMNSDEISAGTISVFFDDLKNVLIIPYVLDSKGIGKALSSIQQLRMPYQPKHLGKLIRISMKLCEQGTACSNTELMSRLGFSSWKDFSEGKRNISIHVRPATGIIFHSTSRGAEGAYAFNYAGDEAVLPKDATDQQIGEITLSLLLKCRR